MYSTRTPLSQLRASVFALSSSGYEKPEDILRDADTAMYRAKENGKARYELFDHAMHARAVSRLQLESDLRQAVEKNEFCVYYQPIVSLQTGRLAVLRPWSAGTIRDVDWFLPLTSFRLPKRPD